MSQRFIDGFVPAKVQSIAASPAPTPAFKQPPARPFASPPAPVTAHKRRLGIPQKLQLPLIILLAMTAGMFADSSAVGQVAIAIYAIAAWKTGIRSRTTFILALIALGTMCILLLGKGDVAQAQNFATYTFLLLVAGVLSLGRELKQEGGRVYSIRTRPTNHH